MSTHTLHIWTISFINLTRIYNSIEHYEINNQSTYIATKNEPTIFVISMSGPRNGCKCCIHLVIECLNLLLRRPTTSHIPNGKGVTSSYYRNRSWSSNAGCFISACPSLCFPINPSFRFFASYVTKLCLPAIHSQPIKCEFATR